MIKVKMNNSMLSETLENVVGYSNGFLDGINLNRLEFNRVLGGYTAEALGNYIDSKARMNSDSLHHVYEWGKVGSQSARLFRFNVKASVGSINFDGKFLPSKSQSSSGQVFSNKAEVMENRISVTVSPRISPVLVFEDDDELVFTPNSVFIENPGGDAVAGSFGRAVDEFFNSYFRMSVLSEILKDLSTPDEFSRYFSQGSKGGRSAGVSAGRKYFSIRNEQA